MKMPVFMLYNILGGWIWIALLLGAGYGAGNLLSLLLDSF
jgi:membrane-associated protein